MRNCWADWGRFELPWVTRHQHDHGVFEVPHLGIAEVVGASRLRLDALLGAKSQNGGHNSAWSFGPFGGCRRSRKGGSIRPYLCFYTPSRPQARNVFSPRWVTFTVTGLPTPLLLAWVLAYSGPPTGCTTRSRSCQRSTASLGARQRR